MTATTTRSTVDPDKPLRGRRLSWAEFRKAYPTARPAANDNKEQPKQDD